MKFNGFENPVGEKTVKRPYLNKSIIVYDPQWEPRIKNVGSIPNGTGAKFLRCLIGENGDLVACSWHRKEPTLEHNYMAFIFTKR